MSPAMCRKVKALLLISMLAVTGARYDQQSIRFNTGASSKIVESRIPSKPSQTTSMISVVRNPQAVFRPVAFVTAAPASTRPAQLQHLLVPAARFPPRALFSSSVRSIALSATSAPKSVASFPWTPIGLFSSVVVSLALFTVLLKRTAGQNEIGKMLGPNSTAAHTFERLQTSRLQRKSLLIFGILIFAATCFLTGIWVGGQRQAAQVLQLSAALAVAEKQLTVEHAVIEVASKTTALVGLQAARITLNGFLAGVLTSLVVRPLRIFLQRRLAEWWRS